MSGAGLIQVELLTQGSAILALNAHAERPLKVLQLLQGRSISDGLRWLTLMFPLCGMAHGLAALAAVEQALGLSPSPAHLHARRLLLAADIAAAHQWRFSLDWPALAGREPDVSAVAAARRATEALALALYPHGDALAPGGGTLQPDADRLEALARASEETGDPHQCLADLRAVMAASLIGTEMLPAIHARLRATADAAQAHTAHYRRLLQQPPPAAESTGSVGAGPTAAAHGSASVASARGPLHYTVNLDAGRWAECTIEAPIDRMFAADGEAHPWLRQLRHAALPVAATRWMLAALDPCAGVRIEHREA